MSELLSNFYFEGAIIGFATFCVIGIFHPIVIKFEYYFGTKPWWVFLVSGLVCIALALLCADVLWSALLAITGFSCLWSIIELFDQKKRVEKGWFPMNPKRKHCYRCEKKEEY